MGLVDLILYIKVISSEILTLSGSTSLQYVKSHFGALHMLGTDVSRSDTP